MVLRAIRVTNLQEVAAARAALPPEFRPSRDARGRWRRAQWGALRVARERRRVVRAGGAWPWHVPRKAVVRDVPFKGHLRDLAREEKREHVRRCMARMPDLIAEYREARKLARAERKRATYGLKMFADAAVERSRFADIVTNTSPSPKKKKGAPS